MLHYAHFIVKGGLRTFVVDANLWLYLVKADIQMAELINFSADFEILAILTFLMHHAKWTCRGMMPLL